MKRRANAILKQPPSKVTPKLTKKYEFLELSICATSTEVNVKSEKPGTARNASRMLTETDFPEPITMANFREMLSREGQIVKNVRIVNGNSVILPSVQEHCARLNRIELLDGEGALPLRKFRNLTEMKLPHVRIATHAFRKCLMNNPNLVSLELDHYWYENELMDLPKLLPNLRSLQLGNIAMGTNGKTNVKTEPSATILKLLESDTLTKFSFESALNCNKLLKELSLKQNLEELHVKMVVNNASFAIIRELTNLTFLAITHTKATLTSVKSPIIWPPRLTHLQLTNIQISDKKLILTVQQLDLLEELHIGTTTADRYPWLQDKTISQIEKKIRSGRARRVLKIFFSNEDTADESPYEHKSAYLEIINDKSLVKVEPLHIMIAC